MALQYTTYIVTFGQLVQHVKPVATHRMYGSINSKVIGYVGRQAL